MRRKIVALILLLALTLTGCSKKENDKGNNQNSPIIGGGGSQNNNENIGDENSSFGEDLKDLGAYDGFFEGQTSDVVVKFVSGTPGCYKLENNVLTFTGLRANSVYSISGKLSGNIVIDVGDQYKLDLELNGLSLVSNSTNPIMVLSGNRVSLQAKKGTENFIYDTRAAISEDDTTSLSGAIHSDVDLELAGKGKLSVVSENNNGIHSKKDLFLKNLSLTVSCKDNALKGNDSVSLDAVTATLIATAGDGIKTTNSDISDKGNQRGIVSILGGVCDIYAACDGIDASYDVVVDGADTKLNIYTDKYSNYSEEVTAVSKNIYYIRFNSSSYKYSIKYYNSDNDVLWVNADYHSAVQGGRTKYYYYSFPKNDSYSKLQLFVYSSTMEQGQENNYVVTSDYITLSNVYDTIALSGYANSIYYDWTNYTTTVSGGGFGGPGGMGPGGMEGNNDKGGHSTKGIKAANEITINNGEINIKSYDDAIHVKNDTPLENGQTPKGNLTINGGNLTICSNDDGLHADGNLSVNGGNVNILNSYEGIEAYIVKFFGGNVSIVSKDDGVNATATSETSITVGGESLYVYAGGDGIDSNSRVSYNGIAFTGGKTLIISTSGGNSAIDSESGYSYTGGSVVAIMPRGGMSNEATHCQNFSSIGKSTNLSLTKGGYLVCKIGNDSLTVNMPVSLSAMIITLGNSSASVNTNNSSSHNLSEGEFIWE